MCPLSARVSSLPLQFLSFEKRTQQCRVLCRLDIGDSPYAANLHIDSKGRVILWLWLRDRRPAPPTCPPSDTCGCLAVPRVLSYVRIEGKGPQEKAQRILFQHPVPELELLRAAKTDLASDLTVPVDTLQLLHTFDGSHFEAQLQLHRYVCSTIGPCSIAVA